MTELAAPPTDRLAMGASATPADLVAAALAWWHDAGVDSDFADTATTWANRAVPVPATARAARARTPPPSAPSASTPISLPAAVPAAPGAPRGQPTKAPVSSTPGAASALFDARAQWPQTAPEFARWWCETPLLPFLTQRRVAPAGPIGAPLMVLIPMPEADDRDGLLSGPAGRMLDGLLAAIGLTRAQVYCASALPAAVAMPDWGDLAAQGIGTLARHHIALAAPQRLLVLGRTSISTLLSHDLPNNTAAATRIAHEDVSVPALFGYDLAALLARPALKSGLWGGLLDWLEGEAAWGSDTGARLR